MSDENDSGGGVVKVLGFILVFGVINAILYFTTGFVLIPK